MPIILFMAMSLLICMGCSHPMSVSDIKQNYQYSDEKYTSIEISQVHKNITHLFDKCAAKTLTSTIYDGGNNIDLVAKSAAYVDVYINITKIEDGKTKALYYVNSISLFNKDLYKKLVEMSLGGSSECP